MHTVLKDENKRLVVRSYPIWMASVPVLLAVLLFFATTLSAQNDFKAVDLIIFYGVCALFVVIHKFRKTTFDVQHDSCLISKRSIMGEQQARITCAEIKKIELQEGRGAFARGGRLVIKTTDQDFPIIDSDIQPGHAKQIRLSQEKIETFLKLNAEQDHDKKDN